MKISRPIVTTAVFAGITIIAFALAYTVPFTALSRHVATVTPPIVPTIPTVFATRTVSSRMESVFFADSQVKPTSGTTTTVFVFSTRYTSLTKSMPTDADVVIDGRSYFLLCVSSNCVSNAYYSISLFLSAGVHHFSFVFTTAGNLLWYDPQNLMKQYSGPVVKGG